MNFLIPDDPDFDLVDGNLESSDPKDHAIMDVVLKYLGGKGYLTG